MDCAEFGESSITYHSQGIFAYAFELAAGNPERMYPTLAQLQADQARNRPTLLLLLEMSACPYAAVGAALAAKHCS